jgi:hypothetical protein
MLEIGRLSSLPKSKRTYIIQYVWNIPQNKMSIILSMMRIFPYAVKQKEYKYRKLWYMYIISECPLHCVIRAISTVVEWRINICSPLVHWSWLLSSLVHSHRTAGRARGWLLYWSISHGDLLYADKPIWGYPYLCTCIHSRVNVFRNGIRLGWRKERCIFVNKHN